MARSPRVDQVFCFFPPFCCRPRIFIFPFPFPPFSLRRPPLFRILNQGTSHQRGRPNRNALSLLPPLSLEPTKDGAICRS